MRATGKACAKSRIATHAYSKRTSRRTLLATPPLLLSTMSVDKGTAAAAASVLTCGVEDRASKVQELLRSPAPKYAAYTSDFDLTTQETWCPDCRRAIPVILKAVKDCGGSLLLINVGPKPAWKTPDHPFKQDASLNVSSVPTLIFYGSDGSEKGRLGPELEACTTTEEATQVVGAFIARTASL